MAYSISTFGGATYDDLLRGEVKYFAPNLVRLYDIENRRKVPFPFKKSVETLRTRVDDTLRELESNTGKTIEEFTIGTSHARRKKSVRNFDPCDFTTWKLDDGVNGCWRKTYKNKEYDGLVVLCAITGDQLTERVRGLREENHLFDQEHYAIALEQSLLQYYAYVEEDGRLGNGSFNLGNLGSPYAGVVYVAYKFG